MATAAHAYRPKPPATVSASASRMGDSAHRSDRARFGAMTSRDAARNHGRLVSKMDSLKPVLSQADSILNAVDWPVNRLGLSRRAFPSLRPLTTAPPTAPQSRVSTLTAGSSRFLRSSPAATGSRSARTRRGSTRSSVSRDSQNSRGSTPREFAAQSARFDFDSFLKHRKRREIRDHLERHRAWVNAAEPWLEAKDHEVYMAEKQRRMRLRDDVRLIESIHKKTQEREHAHLRARTSKDRQLLDELQTCVTQIADALFAGEVTLDSTEGLKFEKRLESDRAFINGLTDIQLLDPEVVKRVRILAFHRCKPRCISSLLCSFRCSAAQFHDAHSFFTQHWAVMVGQMAKTVEIAGAKAPVTPRSSDVVDKTEQLKINERQRGRRRGATISLRQVDQDRLQPERMSAAENSLREAQDAIEQQKNMKTKQSDLEAVASKPVPVFEDNMCTISIEMFNVAQIQRDRVRSHRAEVAKRIAAANASSAVGPNSPRHTPRGRTRTLGTTFKPQSPGKSRARRATFNLTPR